MNEKISSLRYKEPEWIEGPSKVELVEYSDPEELGYREGMLKWSHDPNGHEETRPQYTFASTTGEEIHSPEVPGTEVYLAKRPTDGCLTEFIGLAEASPEEVLAFVGSSGILGIMPLVRVEWPEKFPDLLGPTFHYQEPVFIYCELARKFRSILGIMQALKTGTPVSPSDYHESFPDWADMSPGVFYSSVSNAVSGLWKSGATTLGITQLETMPRGTNASDLSLSGPLVFELGFGRWKDGEAWDYQQARKIREGGILISPGYLFQMRLILNRNGVGFNPDGSLWPDHTEEFENQMKREGFWKTDQGEWVQPYANFAWYSIKDTREYRPTPLWNALVFQLQKAITLPANTYFCSNCNKPYQFNPEAPLLGSSKPRQGRETAFCGKFCRDAYKRQFDRQRYLERKADTAKK